MKSNASRMRSIRILVLVLLTVVLLFALGYALYNVFPNRPPEKPPSVSSSVAPAKEPALPTEPQEPAEPEVPYTLHTPLYELGGYGPDEERRGYQNASMVLSIPRLAYEGAVLEGMTPEIKAGASPTTGMDERVLNHGVVLFNQAQLPGVENRNVSIAGHRDIHGMEFYYADTLTKGDRLYLYYKGIRYTYEYYETAITHPSDWGYVVTNEYSTLTLQTCDPINLATERLFIVAHLVAVDSLSAKEISTLQNTYPAFASEE